MIPIIDKNTKAYLKSINFKPLYALHVVKYFGINKKDGTFTTIDFPLEDVSDIANKKDKKI